MRIHRTLSLAPLALLFCVVLGGCQQAAGCPTGLVSQDGYCFVSDDVVPTAPALLGESITSRTSPVWRWTDVDPLADVVEVRCVGCGAEDWTSVGLTDRWTASVVDDGNHTFEVRACVMDTCGAPATFDTTVERVAPYAGYSGVWTGVHRPLTRGVARQIAAATSGVLVSGFSDVEGHRAHMTEMVTQEAMGHADVLLIPVFQKDDSLYSGGYLERIAQIDPIPRSEVADALDAEALRNSDNLVLLSVEFIEDADAFAAQMMALLEKEHGRSFGHGRPIILRLSTRHADAVAALQSALNEEMFMQHNVWIQVSVGLDAFPNLQAFHNEVDRLVADGVWGVEVDERESSVLARTGYAESRGLAVGFAIPVSSSPETVRSHFSDFGPVADNYLVFDSRRHVRNDSALEFAHGGFTDTLTLDSLAPDDRVGTVGQAMFGPSLGFDRDATQRLIFDGVLAPSYAGYLVAAYVEFDDMPDPNEVYGIVTKGNWDGFALALRRTGTDAPKIRFRTRIGNELIDIQAGVSVREGQGYMVVATVDRGQVRLYVDGRLEETYFAATTDAPNETSAPIAIGAEADSVRNVTNHLSGSVQMALVAPMR